MRINSSISDRTLSALKREYPDSLGISQLSERLGVNDKSIRHAVAKLFVDKKIDRITRGRYIAKLS